MLDWGLYDIRVSHLTIPMIMTMAPIRPTKPVRYTAGDVGGTPAVSIALLMPSTSALKASPEIGRVALKVGKKRPIPALPPTDGAALKNEIPVVVGIKRITTRSDPWT